MPPGGAVVLLATLLAIAPTGPAAATPEAALTGVLGVSAGTARTCAVVIGENVRCWGRGAQGRLGNGGTADHHTPVTVLDPSGSGPLSGIIRVEAGANHTCAVQRTGETTAVYCWGDNTAGKLGDGTTTDRLLPVRVRDGAGPGFLTAPDGAYVSAGLDQTCVAAGPVWCWGRNDFGQLGDGTTTDRRRPVRVRAAAGPGLLGGVETIATGNDHTCASLGTGQVRCWGKNLSGQMGDGTRTQRLRPTTVRRHGGGVLDRSIRVLVGGEHACALRTATTGHFMVCWGDNPFGQLGTGSTTDALRAVPVRAPSGPGVLNDVRAASLGTAHTCATVAADGQVRCWGLGSSIQLGNGSAASRSRPVSVSNLTGTGVLTGATRPGMGGAHGCVVFGSKLVCWGDNASGQIGDGTTTVHNGPVEVQA